MLLDHPAIMCLIERAWARVRQIVVCLETCVNNVLLGVQTDAVSTEVADASDSAHHAQPATGGKTWMESVRCSRVPDRHVRHQRLVLWHFCVPIVAFRLQVAGSVEALMAGSKYPLSSRGA